MLCIGINRFVMIENPFKVDNERSNRINDMNRAKYKREEQITVIFDSTMNPRLRVNECN